MLHAKIQTSAELVDTCYRPYQYQSRLFGVCIHQNSHSSEPWGEKGPGLLINLLLKKIIQTKLTIRRACLDISACPTRSVLNTHHAQPRGLPRREGIHGL